MEKIPPFTGWLIEKDLEVTCKLKQIDYLPQNEVLLDVAYSTINYKDALALLNKAPIARSFPMVPGIDLAGKVIKDLSGKFKKDTPVFINGWEIGEKYWGGLAQRAQIPAKWLQKIPKELDMQSCMAIGTAGYTSMLCILALLDHGISPAKGRVAVTGASGGVGSFAVLFLRKLGFEVVAFTGKEEQFNILRKQGAKEIRRRAELKTFTKALEKTQWAAAIDTVGSDVLASILTATDNNGVVTVCGLTGGSNLNTTVMPFILRGITMVGINSVTQSLKNRKRAWKKIAELITPVECKQMSEIIPLSLAAKKAAELLGGKLAKRVVVKV